MLHMGGELLRVTGRLAPVIAAVHPPTVQGTPLQQASTEMISRAAVTTDASASRQRGWNAKAACHGGGQRRQGGRQPAGEANGLSRYSAGPGRRAAPAARSGRR